MTIQCPNCGKDAATDGVVRCMCDKDFCLGNRCGANELAATYKCASCGAQGTTPEADAYRKRFLD